MNKEPVKVGDITTAYEKGYHKILSIDERNLVHYVRVISEKGNKVSAKKELVCSSAYCSKITEESVIAMYNSKLAELNMLRDNLLEAIKVE